MVERTVHWDLVERLRALQATVLVAAVAAIMVVVPAVAAAVLITMVAAAVRLIPAVL
jgi:hypothetical protein